MKIGFFHTSPVHIATFDQLFAQPNCKFELVHKVDEQLLADAIQHGVNEQIRKQVLAYIRGLADSSCKTIVCTCSTLGAIAEALHIPNVKIYRVDRPMAAKAVAESHIILMVAVLASTLLPTRELIKDEANRQDRPVRVQELVISDAWDYFLAGDLDGYHQHIAEAVKANVRELGRCSADLVPETILLAQASMAGALQYLSELEQPVLSSPIACAEFLKNNVGDKSGLGYLQG
ncbi:MAG: arylsulfatase [Chloroflexota bacterium]